MDELSRLDLAFCVDLTNSMSPFIQAARAQMVRILDVLRTAPDTDLRVAVVGYRDYGTCEVVETYPFAEGATVATDTRATLDRLKIGSPPENTDAAEAV